MDEFCGYCGKSDEDCECCDPVEEVWMERRLAAMGLDPAVV